MSRGGRERRPATTQSAWADSFVERVCLLVLLALIPLRVVIGETATFEVPRLFRHIDVPGGAGPATTFAIFGLVVAMAALVAVSRLRRGQGWTMTGMEIGAGILLVAMVISTLRAGQKHLALVGSLDLLGLVIYAATLRQLMTRPWHIRLALSVILAAGAMVLVKCAYQKWVETPDTIRYFEEHRAELMPQATGEGTGDAGFLYDYEQRLRSGSVSGYFAHPNVLASYLILIAMAGSAVVIERMRTRAAWTLIAPGALAVGALAALAGSQSKGAAAAMGAAIVFWIIGTLLRDALGKRPRATVCAVFLVGVGVAIGLAALLNARPEALGRSMLFRSFYWRGAWAMLLDRGAWGVGANNFGRLFTQYKDVACPEDVEDPHSWVVKAAVEWGLVGLVGVIGVLFGAAWRRAKCGGPLIGGEGKAGSIILWTGGIGAAVFALWGWLISGTTSEYAALVLHIPAIVWVVVMIVVSLDGGKKEFADDSVDAIVIPLGAGLIGFLLHAGIDLAMFNGGAATTFFAIVAAVLATGRVESRDSSPESDHSARKKAAVGVGAIGASVVLAVGVLLVRPAARAAAELRVGRLQSEAKTWDAYVKSPGYAAYRAAANAYALDATATEELLEQLTQRVATMAHVRVGLDLVDEMQARDPQNAAAWQHLATLRYQRFVIGGDRNDLLLAIDATKKAVEAYPTSPAKRLTLAKLYEKLAAAGADDAREQAAGQLEKALELDAARVYVSQPHQYPDAMKTAIRKRIDRLRGG